MPIYEVLGQNGAVLNRIVADAAFVLAHYPDARLVDGSAEPTAPGAGDRPTLLITGVTSDKPAATFVAADLSEATCPVGTTLVFTAELRNNAGEVLLLSDAFRMPIRQRGGREGLLLAEMLNGIVTVSAPFTVAGDDGAWLVDEATINASLPPGLRMTFKGFVVNVHRSA